MRIKQALLIQTHYSSKPMSQGLQNPLIYVPEYWLVVCTATNCCYALPSRRVPSHLCTKHRGEHYDIPLHEQREIVQAIETTPGIIEVEKAFIAIFGTTLQHAIPHVPTQHGFKCIHSAGGLLSICGYICQNLGDMHKHCQTQH